MNKYYKTCGLIIFLSLFTNSSYAVDYKQTGNINNDSITFPRKSIGLNTKVNFGTSLSFGIEKNNYLRYYGMVGYNYQFLVPEIFNSVQFKGEYLGFGLHFNFSDYLITQNIKLKKQVKQSSYMGIYAEVIAGNCSYKLNKFIINPHYQNYNISLERNNEKYLNIGLGLAFNFDVNDRFNIGLKPIEIAIPIGLNENFLNQEVIPIKSKITPYYLNAGIDLNLYLR